MHKKSTVTVRPLEDGLFKIKVKGNEFDFIEEDKLEDENGETNFLITIAKNDYEIIAKITNKEVVGRLMVEEKEDK